jgi:cobalt/nickel transport system ATP-binding protein
VGDCIVSAKTLSAVRRSVGMVFQNSDDQLFMPTVYDDVAFGPLNLGYPEEEIESRVMKALTTVGAHHLAKRPPYKLSQGEKKAVAIASVLVMSPDILVMDEPTASLDPKSRRRLIELLKTFRHTKIIATHDLDMAFDICERTIVIHQGKITADGRTGEIFRDRELLDRSGLEPPLCMQPQRYF